MKCGVKKLEFVLFMHLCCSLTQAEPGLNLQEILCCLSPVDSQQERFDSLTPREVLLGGVHRVLLPLESFFNTLKCSQRGKRLDWELT